MHFFKCSFSNNVNGYFLNSHGVVDVLFEEFPLSENMRMLWPNITKYFGGIEIRLEGIFLLKMSSLSGIGSFHPDQDSTGSDQSFTIDGHGSFSITQCSLCVLVNFPNFLHATGVLPA